MTQHIYSKDQIPKKVLFTRICRKVGICQAQEFAKNKTVKKDL
jgi:hypothetical protein